MKYMSKGILLMFIALGLGLILAIGITYMFYEYGETTNQTTDAKDIEGRPPLGKHGRPCMQHLNTRPKRKRIRPWRQHLSSRAIKLNL